MICVDTSVWVDFFAGRNEPHVSVLESLIVRQEDLCICGVIFTEVLQGIRDDREYRHTELILANLLYLPMTQDTFLNAAQLYRTLRAQGITIRNTVDCMIAATCIEHGVSLLHHDRDFGFIASQSLLQIVSFEREA